MAISVIIPAYNEAQEIAETVSKVIDRGGEHIREVLVIDGDSTDGTVEIAEEAGSQAIRSPRKGRAAQMNYGAAKARGEVLYFLHADSHPPPHYAEQIVQALGNSYAAGCFQLNFDDNHFLLNFYSWFTQFNVDAFRFGDQSLFIRRDVFEEVGEFSEDHIVMEDQEMVRRIKRSHPFIILDQWVTTSARKYREVGILKLQLIFILIFMLYYLGVNQEQLVGIYKRLV